jgi:D-sedoheptulose 7-phosphate isomerase
MNADAALQHITSYLSAGADLRHKVARECGPAIVKAAVLIRDSLKSGGKILFCGNGGSAADAQHLAAEFVGRFVRERCGLPSIALTTDSSILTAVGNDYGFDRVFSRQVEALGCLNDIVVGITTSGNSPNVILAMKEAAGKGLKTIGLAGKDGGALKSCVTVPIVVPENNTARVQECHIAIGHLLCELVEEDMFGNQK